MSEKEILEAKKNSKNITIDDITVLNEKIPVLSEEKEEKKEEVKKEEPKEETTKVEAPKVEIPTVAAPAEEKKEEKPLLSGFTVPGIDNVPNAPTDIPKPPVAPIVSTPSFAQPSVQGSSPFVKQANPMVSSLYNGSSVTTSTSEFKSHTEIDEYYDNKNKGADRFCEETKRTNDIERQKAHSALNKTDAFEEWRKNLFNIPGVDDTQTIQNAPASNGVMFGQTNDANDIHRIM